MSIARIVEPELLDSLPADDPRAVRSRRDLARINRWMASSSLLFPALDALLVQAPAPARLVEIGAGDGGLLLRLGQRHARRWPPLRVSLLDLQPVVDAATLEGYRALGWSVEVVQADVLDWLARPAPRSRSAPIMLANLFVHHFQGERLQALLHGIATHARAFVCLEPRRSSAALTGSRLVGAIGGNDVTRHDAVASVRAGFTGQELSHAWPRDDAWQLHEGAAGLFSHRFVATRSDRSAGTPA